MGELVSPRWISLCEQDPTVAVAYYDAVSSYNSAFCSRWVDRDVVDEGSGSVPRGVDCVGDFGSRRAGLVVTGGFGDCGSTCGDGCQAGIHGRGAAGLGLDCEQSVGVQPGVEGLGDGLAAGGLNVSGSAGGEFSSGSPGGTGVGYRGKNWHRNQVTKMRRRIKARERREAVVAEKAVEADRRAQGLLKLSSWRNDGCTDKERELRDLKVERQIIQEKRKLEKLKSPEQVLIDAMRHVAFAERCAKSANDSKVAGWAATVATAYAESVARSASDSVPSLDSVTADRAAKVAREKKAASFSVAELPMNKIEQAAVDFGVFTESKLEGFRSRVERCLRYSDFQTKDAPRLSHFQRNALNDAYARYG